MAQLITVTGNTGKTLFSFLLATKLANKDKRVIIISTDSNAPSFLYAMPVEKKAEAKSLGKVLSLPIISPHQILENMISFSCSENIGCICYNVNESNNSYPDILESNLDTFFNHLNSLVDYIIVDTETRQNIIDQYCIHRCESEICIASADLKGLAYRQRYDNDKTIHVLYHCSPYNPFEDIQRTYSKQVKYILPYCKQFGYIFNGGHFDDIVNIPKAYDKTLNKLIKEVISNE
ncbi:hypothetical protein RBG61_06530 [Paludicola sp. MB14-C6]|uniref:hypothetical protein n=1 Tax=Paludihabitans sp. MB14-C6 TaxID=3070656 RepID=UPI0027DD1967|nr:hypothetical protein [Paludicola sp. MB14-C6]WMJ24317.1 hypothetical protein RBG61_06530 [Paludicola sp. MB14-C6]